VADPAGWELWPAPDRFPEFNCLCPRSDYLDFATVHLVTVPHTTVVELKHLKLWLNLFRDRPISHELATAEIAATLADRLDLHYAFVLLDYTPRGNLTTFPMVEHQHPWVASLDADEPLRLALDLAKLAKRLLVERVLAAQLA
jgi:NADPH-dependent 7-cyano-7-deazaguanine reductase QueF